MLGVRGQDRVVYDSVAHRSWRYVSSLPERRAIISSMQVHDSPKVCTSGLAPSSRWGVRDRCGACHDGDRRDLGRDVGEAVQREVGGEISRNLLEGATYGLWLARAAVCPACGQRLWVW